MDLFKKLMKMNLPLIIGLITELVVIYKGVNNIMTNYIGLNNCSTYNCSRKHIGKLLSVQEGQQYNRHG